MDSERRAVCWIRTGLHALHSPALLPLRLNRRRAGCSSFARAQFAAKPPSLPPRGMAHAPCKHTDRVAAARFRRKPVRLADELGAATVTHKGRAALCTANVELCVQGEQLMVRTLVAGNRVGG